MAVPIHHNAPSPFNFFFFFFMLFIPFHNSQNYPPFSVSHSLTLSKIQHLLLTDLNLRINATTTRADFCNTSIALANPNGPNPNPNPSLTLVCYHNNITQLHVTGEYLYNNVLHPPTLPPNFSAASFVSAVASALPALKVLCLVSLGLRGPFPGAIIAANLPSLEILNVSSNHFTGNIPIEISCLHNLQTLILDHNCFSGTVPNWLSSLPLLTVASFKNNSLTGSLPNSLSGLSSLRILVLATNHLSGDVPSGFSNLTSLQVLDLEDNNFGPYFPLFHNKLISIVLRRNSFRFGIPDEYLTSFYQLQKLDISANEFNGPFSPSLLSLPSLTYLDISGNKFSGMLFRNASCSDQLAFVNLSSNRLTGELPRCLHGSSKRVVYYDGNCLSSREHNLQQRYPDDSLCYNGALAVRITPQGRKRKSPFRKTVFAAGIAGGVVGGITLFGMVFLVVRRDYISNSGSKTTRTRLILEQNKPASTIKMLTDASKKYLFVIMGRFDLAVNL